MSGEPQPFEDELTGELRRARASRKRLPDFFIVGHPKCGTTAMYEMLRAHPQIYMPDLKETQFFAREPQHRTKASKQRLQTLEDYLSLFEAAQPEQRAGEASTSYLRSRSAASRIAELRPDARIIAIFREPAHFLHSLHLQLLQAGIETEADFASAIALEEERRRGKHIRPDSFWDQALLYSEHVRYVEQLRRYHEHFGRERVLALIYDDFRLDSEQVVRRVLRFLELDDSLELVHSEANPTVRMRSRRVDELLHATSMGQGPISGAVKAAIKVVFAERVRRQALQTVRRRVAFREPRSADEEFMGELRVRFKPEVTAVSKYLGRDLVSEWGYDEVG